MRKVSLRLLRPHVDNIVENLIRIYLHPAYIHFTFICFSKEEEKSQITEA